MSNYPENQEFDKTFIEGDLPQAPLQPQQPTQSQPVQQPTAIRPATSTGSVSSAGQTNVGQTSAGGVSYQRAEQLPSGQEPIPLGSGTIAGLLGSGGMARVYKIWNEKLEVYRAVKIIIPGHGSDLKNRFETEAKITAKLHHPNIVEIYGVDDWNGLPILEMEFIDGVSLEGLIQKQGKLPDAVCSAISILVCRALTYAHCQQFLLYGKTYNGVIHRDLKPANIMISREGTVKLMDFGIARPTDASFHTVEGSVVGTLQYLAPEQLDGVNIDARADLYAFGTILYEMLTGIKTFPQKTITNLMKTKAVNEFRKIEDFDFEVNSGLGKAAQKCLQVSPEHRFKDAKALLQALEALHTTISSDTPEQVIKDFIADPVMYKGPKNKKKLHVFKPVILIPAGLVVALGLVGGIVFMTGPKGDQVVVQPKDTTKVVIRDSVAPKDTTARTADTLVVDPVDRVVIDTPVVKPRPRPPVDPPKPRPVEDGLAKIYERYGSREPFTVARAAISANSYKDVIAVLSKLPDNHAEVSKRNIYLLEAYVQSSQLAEATAIATKHPVDDAQFELYAGKLYLRKGDLTRALASCERALLRPSIVRSRGEVINDALYYTAQIRKKMYEETPTADSKGLAQTAWLKVRQIYQNNPESARFQEANNALMSLR